MFRMFRSRPAPTPAPEPESVRQRVHRLEIELTELRDKFDLHQLAYQRFQGKVFGHLGAPNRDAVRNSGAKGETLEEYRDRMLRSGLLRAQRGDNDGATQ